MDERRIWINEDNASFYIGFPAEAMSVAGCQALVDTYVAQGAVEGISFCANVSRALFDSQVWEPLYTDYDPEAGDDQACLAWLPPDWRSLDRATHGRTWIHHLWLLRSCGVDHLAVWLDRCRHHGVQGRLSMRMNDVHHAHEPTAFWHHRLWRERPELRRAPHRDEGWFEHAYDYRHDTVVAHHCALIDELCDRYDLDGLELDWVRWVRHAAPGAEAEVAPQLTRVMRHARAATGRATARLGRPVQLGARLPADVPSCLQLGYDLPTWAREGLLDHVIAAPFFQQAPFQVEVALWRALFPAARVLVQPESILIPAPDLGEGELVFDPRILAGSAASALQRGADGVWVFNECYRFQPDDHIARRWPEFRSQITGLIGDLEALREAPRRQVVSYDQIVGPGRRPGSPLPVPLRRPAGSFDFNRFRDTIPLSLPLGPAPRRAAVTLKLGLDRAAPLLDAEQARPWLNGHQLGPAQVEVLSPDPDRFGRAWPPCAAQGLSWDCPLAWLHDGDNSLEWLPPAVDGAIVWAEFAIG